MFSSLFRPKRSRNRSSEQRPLLALPSNVSPFAQVQDRDNTGYFERPIRGMRKNAAQDIDDDDLGDEDQDAADDEDPHEERTPLLPIFSAAQLDVIPVYNLTHAIRLLIVKRCETTLSWDQIRSPQITQFLVKPIQQEILASHLTRATIYSLLANCLQFTKETAIDPGNAGVSRTRALLAELLAMRMLREFSTRELIDCLAYDFDPLHGSVSAETTRAATRLHKSATRDLGSRHGVARTSALEVAIRASAKRFLAHRLVVQHLEAVWAGNICFHNAQDSLHRYPEKPSVNQARQYGSTYISSTEVLRGRDKVRGIHGQPIRRSVTLYNPGDASLFKLSRLRVPRYRQLFSTFSYAIMLGLFIAILVQKSVDITAVEVLFWFWSAGFMLDEIVGFTEQGFGLYIISVWNAFDLGILLLFMVYYVMRLYGIIIAETHKHSIASMAYDVLASTAILLFPRLFSYLDHYRYFSQLLIAFRMMALDLVAVLVLIIISCSGFFVAFAVGFSAQSDFRTPSGVVYALFQIVMGFTPAAWSVWDQYNVLGKALLVIFLTICHFVVITILITVLTNSFMKVVQNANEEHQYLYAVNTLSMVKSDALFSYIAPSNILGWLCSPLRYILPFRTFVKLNRTIIKITHFPILLIIFSYERLMLGQYAWEPAEIIEQRGRRKRRVPTFAMNPATAPFSPAVVREPSIRTYYKDQALEEVFRHPLNDQSTVRKTQHSVDRESNVVDRWMNTVGLEGGASPPMEQPRSVLEQLEGRRPQMRRAFTAVSTRERRGGPAAPRPRSVLSDPERQAQLLRRPQPISEESGEEEESELTTTGDQHPTDAEGDDERVTIAAEDDVTSADEDTTSRSSVRVRTMPDSKENLPVLQEEDVPTPTGKPPLSVFTGPSTPTTRRLMDNSNTGSRPRTPEAAAPSPGRSTHSAHGRQASAATIVYHPHQSPQAGRHSSSPSPHRGARPTTSGRPNSGVATPRELPSNTRRVPNISVTRPRPTLPQRAAAAQSTPNVRRFLELASHTDRRHPSFDAIALDLASNVGDPRERRDEASTRRFMEMLNDETNFLGTLNAPLNLAELGMRRESSAVEDNTRTNRMMLARMNTLEAGFKDMLNEVKEWKSVASSRGTSANESVPVGVGSVAERRLMRRMEKRRDGGGAGPSSLRPGSARTHSNETSGTVSRPNSGPSGLSQEVPPPVNEVQGVGGGGSWHELERSDTAVRDVQQRSGSVERPEIGGQMRSF